MTKLMRCDVLIIGGGIAGLWLLHRLAQQGIDARLCEKEALGFGQTVRSQGILHGGTKYALKGKLTKSALGVAEMPAIWQACLRGDGEIDLSRVKVLSGQHYLWTLGRYTSKLKSFVSSKVLSSDSAVLDQKDYPEVLQHPDCTGSVCTVNETVLDIPDLLAQLRAPMVDRLLFGEAELVREADRIAHARICHQGGVCEVQAQRYVCLAGAGNEALVGGLPNAPKMQRRPLQMTWVCFPKEAKVPEAFLHCIEQGATPVLTITSHHNAQGQRVWYLGGALSEEGVKRSKEAQIAEAKAVLSRVLPWVNLHGATWHTGHIDRAEITQPGGKRPESVFVEKVGEQVLVGWPTKLVLAPLLAAQAQSLLQDIQPADQNDHVEWPSVPIAQPWWDRSESCKELN